MSLKMKLTSTICAFLLILGLVITGVFAVPQATVNLGGTLTFKASDVYARVTGTITGSKEDPTLTPIEFNAGSASGTSTWTNNLAFKDEGSEITISINVENLASDRPLYVSIVDSVGTIVNVSKTLTNGAFELAAGANDTATFTMEVTNKNASITSGANYGYVVELLDASAIPSYDAVSGLTLTCDTNAKTASVTGHTLTAKTDVVIPAYVKSGDVVCEVTSVGGFADMDGNGGYLSSIVLPNTITTISGGAFYGNTNFTNLIIPEKVTELNEMQFQGCSGITNVLLNNNLTTLSGIGIIGGHYTYIEIPSSLSIIGLETFFNCYQLETIVIPSSVTEIGYNAFSSCSALKTVLFKGTAEQWSAISIWEGEGNDPVRNANIIYI